MLVDSHCHLYYPEIFSSINEHLSLMEKNNVTSALCVSTDDKNMKDTIEIANQFNNIYAALGIHPNDTSNCEYKKLAQMIEPYLSNKKLVGIGETGLDYYYDEYDISAQQDSFRIHIEIASKYQLPLIIHSRNAMDDTLDILAEYNLTIPIIIHCFTENQIYAKRCLDRGYYLSISGIVTFKNASEIKKVAQLIPDDQLLIETDSPFLAPVPFRGKHNHPGLLKYTAEYVAKLRDCSLEKLSMYTTKNFYDIFLSQ